MKTTFLIAQNLAVSPFDVMSQDLEYVIMVINYLIEGAYEKHSTDNVLSEKDKDRDFWSAL